MGQRNSSPMDDADLSIIFKSIDSLCREMVSTKYHQNVNVLRPCAFLALKMLTAKSSESESKIETFAKKIQNLKNPAYLEMTNGQAAEIVGRYVRRLNLL